MAGPLPEGGFSRNRPKIGKLILEKYKRPVRKKYKQNLISNRKNRCAIRARGSRKHKIRAGTVRARAETEKYVPASCARETKQENTRKNACQKVSENRVRENIRINACNTSSAGKIQEKYLQKNFPKTECRKNARNMLANKFPKT